MPSDDEVLREKVDQDMEDLKKRVRNGERSTQAFDEESFAREIQESKVRERAARRELVANEQIRRTNLQAAQQTTGKLPSQLDRFGQEALSQDQRLAAQESGQEEASWKRAQNAVRTQTQMAASGIRQMGRATTQAGFAFAQKTGEAAQRTGAATVRGVGTVGRAVRQTPSRAWNGVIKIKSAVGNVGNFVSRQMQMDNFAYWSILLLYLIDLVSGFNYMMRIVIYIPAAAIAAVAWGGGGDLKSTASKYFGFYLLVVLPPFMKFFSIVYSPATSIFIDYFAVYGNLFVYMALVRAPDPGKLIYKLPKVAYFTFIVFTLIGSSISFAMFSSGYTSNINVNLVMKGSWDAFKAGYENTKIAIVRGLRGAKNIVPNYLDIATNGAYTGNADTSKTRYWALEPSATRLFNPPKGLKPNTAFHVISTFDGFREVQIEGEVVRKFEDLSSKTQVNYGCRAYKLLDKERTSLGDGTVDKSSDILFNMLGWNSAEPVSSDVRCSFTNGLSESGKIEVYAGFSFAAEAVHTFSYIDQEEALSLMSTSRMTGNAIFDSSTASSRENTIKGKLKALEENTITTTTPGPVVIATEWRTAYPLRIDTENPSQLDLLISIHNTHASGQIAGLSDFTVSLPKGFTLSECSVGRRQENEGTMSFSKTGGDEFYSTFTANFPDTLFPVTTSLSMWCPVTYTTEVLRGGAIKERQELRLATNYNYEVVDKYDIVVAKLPALNTGGSGGFGGGACSAAAHCSGYNEESLKNGVFAGCARDHQDIFKREMQDQGLGLDLVTVYAFAYTESSCNPDVNDGGILRVDQACLYEKKCSAVEDQIHYGIQELKEKYEAARALGVSDDDAATLMFFGYNRGVGAMRKAAEFLKADPSAGIQDAMVKGCKAYFPNPSISGVCGSDGERCCNSPGLGAGYPERVKSFMQQGCQQAGGSIALAGGTCNSAEGNSPTGGFGQTVDMSDYISREQVNIVSTRYKQRSGTVDMIVMHHTAGRTVKDALLSWVNRKASAHYIVDKDGTIVTVIPENQAAWHATCVNGHSIGIEIVNLGEGNDPYPPAQVQAVDSLVKYLADKYHIQDGNIIGHGCVTSNKMASEPTDLPRDLGNGLKLYTRESNAPYPCTFLGCS